MCWNIVEEALLGRYINWVNDMTHSNLSVNEISEKLVYLSLQYKRGIERHKLKLKISAFEILAATGVGNPASNIVKMVSTILNLCEEEGKLPGREIAYIYHANPTF